MRTHPNNKMNLRSGKVVIDRSIVYEPVVKQQKRVTYEIPDDIYHVRDQLKMSFKEYMEIFNEYENLRSSYHSNPTMVRNVAHSAVQELSTFVDELRTVCENPTLLEGLKKYFPKYLTSVHLSIILQFSELRCLERRYGMNEKKYKIYDEILTLQEKMYAFLDNYGAIML